MTTKPSLARRGPEAERVKIEGMDWQEAVAKALQKACRADGQAEEAPEEVARG